MNTATVKQKHTTNGIGNETKLHVTLTIPGQIVCVEDSSVTIELPMLEPVAVLTEEARRVLLKGLSDTMGYNNMVGIRLLRTYRPNPTL